MRRTVAGRRQCRAGCRRADLSGRAVTLFAGAGRADEVADTGDTGKVAGDEGHPLVGAGR